MIRPRGVGPRLGASWEGRPADLLAALAGVVDVLEILPDCLAGPAGIVPARLAELDALAPDLPVTYHGIGLSIGTVGGWNDDYLHLLDTLWEWRKPLWHSEHLGFTTVSGSSLGAMPALPCTPEAAALVIDRVAAIQESYAAPFLLEHVASPLARPDEWSLARFLNTIAERSGTRLLLDLHNLECDADNGLLDLPAFLDELEWAQVAEIHVAGGVWAEGYHLDVHARTVAASTLDLLDLALDRAPALDLVVFEVLAAAVGTLGIPAILGQLADLRGRLDARVRAA